MLQKKKSDGFTIIEVLIVLAIAGLIILIVLLAVPALQRNSRNTQRKNDVTAVIGAIQEHVNNNGGQLPANAAAFMSNAKLGFYAPGDVNYATSATAVTAAPGTNTSTVYVRSYMKCANATTIANTGATSRNVAAWFYVETSNGTYAQCQEL